MTQVATVEQAVTLLNSMLNPDGYSVVALEWPANGTGLARFQIVAGPDACADCLVPKNVMKMILKDQLPPTIVIDEDGLVYPSEESPH